MTRQRGRLLPVFRVYGTEPSRTVRDGLAGIGYGKGSTLGRNDAAPGGEDVRGVRANCALDLGKRRA